MTTPAPEPGASLARALERLRAGEPVVVATETVYGVACDARNETAVQAVFALKGRPETNPLPVLVADVAAARSLADPWPAVADRLAQAFWPGALTIVVPLGAELAPSVTRGHGSLALRCPDHPIARMLAESFAGPLALTSANRSREPGARTEDEARAFVRDAGRSDIIVLSGGAASGGVVSTIVRVVGEREDVEILRHGAVGEDEILAALQ